MQYSIERRRRENMRRKRRRARQIRRRVCFAVIICITAAIFAFTARKSRKAAESGVYIQIETGAEIVTASGEKNKDQISQIAETSETTAAAVQSEPVFVCLPVPMSEEEQRIIFDICSENGVAFSFVMAIIGKESEFEKEARSATGDSGYMQINDCNAEELERRGYTDLYDTAQNVGAGVFILRDLFDKYDGETHRVLMAYNMGERRAAELWAHGIETSEYSREIVEREAEYSRYMDEQKGGGN